MRGLGRYRVLVAGLQGPGVEIAKNLILAGAAAVTLHDPAACRPRDQSSNFYITSAHAADGVSRAEACLPQLRELNAYVRVEVLAGDASAGDDVGCGVPAGALGAHDCVVAVNKSLAETARLGDACRAAGVHLVAASSRGLFGSVFVDLGESFTTLDGDGEAPKEGVVVDIGAAAALPEAGEDGATHERVVSTDPDRLHMLADGDVVSFALVGGACGDELNGADGRFRVRVVDKSSFAIRLPALAGGPGVPSAAYVRGGHWTQHKQPATLSFRHCSDFLGGPGSAAAITGPLNYVSMERPAHLHALSQVLDEAGATSGAAEAGSAPLTEEEGAAIAARAAELVDGGVGDEAQRALLGRLAAVARGDLSPMAAVIGGVAAQEVLKAGSRKFTPLCQWVYLDAAEALPALPPAEDRAEGGGRYDGQVAVFGRRHQARLGAVRTFVVGAGALGCELLKSYALMGVGCGESGRVDVTDMDSIETSNLNRQFLFRQRHVGSAKSTVAAAAAAEMNPDMEGHVSARELKVAPETATTFDHAFWSGLDVVTNALDNVQARRYVDGLCVEHGLPLLESGTLGTKSNTMTVVPGVTLSYSSEQDAPEQDIPACTLKSFPYLIEHTLQWARNAFEDAFVIDPREAQTFAAEAAGPEGKAPYRALLDRNRNQALQRAASAHRVLAPRPADWPACVRWGREQFERLFVWPIRDLLAQNPLDKASEDGTPFWTAKKRPPAPAVFSLGDPLHAAFLRAAAVLRARTCGVEEGDATPESMGAALAGFEAPAWTPSGEVIATTEEEAAAQAKARADAAEDTDAAVGRLLAELPDAASLAGAAVRPESFEKDDDSNHHIEFIGAAGNIRAGQYGIPAVEPFKVKGIVGRIIPAIATTTAYTTGLVCLELLKLVRPSPDGDGSARGAAPLPIDAFRDSNTNLAINSYAAFEPDPCPERRWGDPDAAEEDRHPATLWTFLELRAAEGVTTMQGVVDWFEERGVAVDSVSLRDDSAMVELYSSLGDEEDATRPFAELYREVTSQDLPTHRPYVILEVFPEPGEDEDEDGDGEEGEEAKDEESEIPPVKLFFAEA